MNLKTLSMMGALLLLAGTGANAQKKKEVLNDSNTPLHLLQPAYKVPYGMLTTEEIKADMDRVLRYLEKNTPTRVVDKNTGKVITDYANMTADAQLERGAFRLASYEWGVTYSAMLAAAEATGDQAYYKYVTDRFQFLAEVAPHFRKVLEKYGTVDPQMKQILTPHALDDAGAVCAAMVKVQMKKNSPELKPLIDNYMDFIVNKEYRLADGTFARTRPQHNTLWLDDMFMGIPPIAWYSCIAGDKQQAYLSEAVRQIFQFADRMWVPEKKLFRHGWVEGMQDHPVIFLVTLGGFCTNAAYCIQQNIKNRTGKEYLSVSGDVLVNNVLFCALAGVLWYSQFFGLEMGKSFLGGSPILLAFSWSILMSLNVTFSNVWGILLKEWKGCGSRTIGVLILGLAVLIASIIVVAMAQA